jgi:NhaC family Na+:H+ antiporter
VLETLILATFAAMLALGTGLHLPLPVTLMGGFFLFMGYGLRRGFKLRELLRFSLAGIKTVTGVLALLAIVGIMAALWRASGTIPTIVLWGSKLMTPRALVVFSFLLCCLMSMLMGTAFGTAATAGIVCMSLAHAMGANTLLVGGAVLAGSYFGDRNSPMSSSAALVATLTHTNIFDNVHAMLKSGLVPFILSCVIYAALGHAFAPQQMASASSADVLAQAFYTGALCLIPAAVVVTCTLRKVDVKITMLLGCAAAALLCITQQHIPASALPQIALLGYAAPDTRVAALVDGGGLLSMVNIELVIALSATFAGLFEGTGLLLGMREHVRALSCKTTAFTSIFATSLATSCIACNQTLAIMLTDQLCHDLGENNNSYALALEDTVVTCAALMPWSIAATATLSFIQAPTASILAACFLYLLPLCTLARSWMKRALGSARGVRGMRGVRGTRVAGALSTLRMAVQRL